MGNLIDEITQADADLQHAEERVTEASRRLRHAKRERTELRQELSRLITELKTGESRFPLLERFGPAGEAIGPGGNGTHDEHSRTSRDCEQRGPTDFPVSAQSPATAETGRRARKKGVSHAHPA